MPQPHLLYPLLRKAVEIIAVLLSLPMVFLVGGIIACLIKKEDGGTVIFTQKRVGRNGKLFAMYKFRTMVMHSSRHFALATENDVRITRTGKWLRRFRLDELPQIVNLLKGEMNCIGPRPVPAELYAYYREHIPEYDARHSIAPGITGLAQVVLGYTTTVEGEQQKLALDMQYIGKQGAKMDVLILWWTLKMVLNLGSRPVFKE